MFKRSASGFVAGVITATLLAGGGAYAATGGKFILGGSNSSGRTTTLASKHGPALALRAKGASLKVSNSAKIANLNADMLDGLSSGSFASAAAKTYSFNATGVSLDTDGNGLTDAVGAIATCPRGMQMTSGGYEDLTSTGIVWENSPNTDKTESWMVILVVDEDSGDGGPDLTATVTCWSPTGRAAAGAFRPLTKRTTTAADFSRADLRRVATKVAAFR